MNICPTHGIVDVEMNHEVEEAQCRLCHAPLVTDEVKALIVKLEGPKGLKPEQCQIGLEVLYYPTLGGPGFRGVVDSWAWQIGGGEWVVHVDQLEDAYSAHVGIPGKRRVAAASLEALSPAPPVLPSPVGPYPFTKKLEGK